MGRTFVDTRSMGDPPPPGLQVVKHHSFIQFFVEMWRPKFFVGCKQYFFEKLFLAGNQLLTKPILDIENLRCYRFDIKAIFSEMELSFVANVKLSRQ